MLQNKHILALRQLLAPEIRVAATQTYASTVVDENDANKQAQLQTLFHLFDEVKEEEACSLLIGAIHVLLQDTEDSLSAANRGGLPPGMFNDELQQLLQNYYNAHEAMREVVSRINDALKFQGTARLDALQLDQNFLRSPEDITLLQPALFQTYKHLLDILRQQDDNLQIYCTHEDVFAEYVSRYYNKQGWMVYHRDFGSGGDESTSIIDAVAMFKKTRVRIWTYEDGLFLFRGARDTTVWQWYHRYSLQRHNHFIGLLPNPDLQGISNL